MNLTELRQILTTYFNENELRDLCFDLDVDYDGLPGEEKGGKARELIAYLERRGRVSDLMETVKSLRPNVSWEHTLETTEGGPDISTVRRESKRRGCRAELRIVVFLISCVLILLIPLIWWVMPRLDWRRWVTFPVATPCNTRPATPTCTPEWSVAWLTDTPTASTTPTCTPTPTPKPKPFTPTPTLTGTPTPPTAATPRPALLVSEPTLIEPPAGITTRGTAVFRWQGRLGTGQFFVVHLRHPVDGWVLESEALKVDCWETTLPAERFGEWRWQVRVVRGSTILAQSEERHLWLDPFPRQPLPTLPTPCPCGE